MITANNLQHVSFIALFFSFLLLLFFAPAFEACSSRPETSGYSCPPFISTLSFPFSTTQPNKPSLVQATRPSPLIRLKHYYLGHVYKPNLQHFLF